MLALRRVPIFWIHLAASKIQGRKPGSPLSGEKQGQLQGRRPGQVCSPLALTIRPSGESQRTDIQHRSLVVGWRIASVSYSDCEEFGTTSNSRFPMRINERGLLASI